MENKATLHFNTDNDVTRAGITRRITSDMEVTHYFAGASCSGHALRTQAIACRNIFKKMTCEGWPVASPRDLNADLAEHDSRLFRSDFDKEMS